MPVRYSALRTDCREPCRTDRVRRILSRAAIINEHRDHATTLGFITGHEDPAKKLSQLDWEKLATAMGTLVFYMGLANLENICEQLVAHGRSPQTPVAVVRWATTPRQQTLSGTLADIVAKVRGEGMVFGIECGPIGHMSANEVANAAVEACYRGLDGGDGIHLLGPLAGNVLRISPPMTMTPRQADESLELMYQILARLADRLESKTSTRSIARSPKTSTTA